MSTAEQAWGTFEYGALCKCKASGAKYGRGFMLTQKLSGAMITWSYTIHHQFLDLLVYCSDIHIHVEEEAESIMPPLIYIIWYFSLIISDHIILTLHMGEKSL